jgi:transposase
MKRKKPKKNRKRKLKEILEKVNVDVAGVDVGAETHFVAVPTDRVDTPVRKFRSFTADLHKLADWLAECGIKSVAMESTGVYWIPLYEILEERGFEVLLVNARHVKNVPGRKTDVLDCQWLQQLHTYGLLRGSFRPPQDIAQLRSYLRHRENLVEYGAHHIQHMQKALTLMNIQLHNVISDITGQTGMRIVHAILSGNHNPHRLAKYRDGRCRASEETIANSLTGNYRPEHLFALKQAVDLYEFYQQKIKECDAEIEKVLNKLGDEGPTNDPPPPPQKTKRRGKNQPSFDIRSPLYKCTGVDLTQIDGIGSHTALRVISEIGVDMSAWPTEKNFTSWLTLAPRNKITGGKILSSKTQRSANRVAKLLRLAATSIGKTSTALGAFYRRLGARAGKAIAVTATARKLAILIYRMLKHGMQYQDPGANFYETTYRSRVVKNMRKRAKSLGFQLIPLEASAECGGSVSS